MFASFDLRKSFPEWFIFHEFEDKLYTAQKRFQEYKLFSAKDALDLYSNHAQPHIVEVMEQCFVLFYSMEEWIKERLPQMDRELLFRHLLTAAKLHDIGMAPTDEKIELLSAIDEMYTFTVTRTRDSSQLKMLCQKLISAAERAGLKSDCRIRVISAICSMSVISREGWKKLPLELAAKHDEVKQSIRKLHAPVGGLIVLDNAQKIKACYGNDLDIIMIASLINLHSTSSTACTAIGYDDLELREKTAECIRNLLAQRSLDLPSDQMWLNAVVTLSTLLRLADARRSGTRMTSIDGSRLFYKCKDENVDLYVERNGIVQRITDRTARSILLSECSTDFGDVRLISKDNRWEMQHELHVHGWSCAELRRLIFEKRLPSYIDELSTAELASSGKVSHLIKLKVDCEDCFDVQKELRHITNKYINVAIIIVKQ